MFSKGITYGIATMALFCSTAFSSPKGMGMDILHPLAVADYDNIADQGSLALNFTTSGTGNKAANSGYFNFGLGQWGKIASLSSSLLLYQSEFDNQLTKYDANELQFCLYLNRSIFKSEDKRGRLSGWRPSKFGVNSYLGLGYAKADIEFEALNTDPLVTNLTTSLGQEASGHAFVLNAGLVSNWSITKRHGVEAYVHFDRHFFSGQTYFNDTAVAITAGIAYAYRFKSQNFFPPELIFGIAAAPQQNDIEESDNLGYSISYRLRY